MTILLGVTFVGVLKWVGYIAVALLCLMFMIIIHELGHYTAGKIFGFKINEFSIGFGPAIFKKTNKKNGELFAIRCVPLGGYCAFAGEDSDAVEPGDFNSKPVWQRIIVLFSGAFFNYLSAMFIISIFFMSFGEIYPIVYDTYQFVDSEQTQLLQKDDIIVKVNGKEVYSLLEPDKVTKFLSSAEEMTLTIKRDGELMNLNVKKSEYMLEKTDENGQITTSKTHGLGISVGFVKQKLPFFKSIGHAFGFGFDVIGLIFRSIGSVFTGHAKVSETLGGTVTAIGSLASMTQYGFASVMYGVCVLSSSLAIMNLLPIPALDGSRIVFAIIEGIRRKPINRKVEAIIHTVGLVLLFGLTILLDILHFMG